MTANTHHTKLKGDIAVAAVILDLTKKGYIISEPMSENAPYDLICDTGEKLLRIQVKYRVSGEIPKTTSWNDTNGNHKQEIDITKIDYFALVNEDYSIICYPPSNMIGTTIRFKIPINYKNNFHWYRDYLEFTNMQPMKKLNSLNEIQLETNTLITKEILNNLLNENKSIKELVNIFNVSNKTIYNLIKEYQLILPKDKIIKISKIEEQQDILHPKKIQWPSIEQMKTLVYEKPTSQLAIDLGVSDVAIGKFCKKHNIAKPPRGHWSKNPTMLYPTEL